MSQTSNQYQFTLTRTFDAPRDLVWKAWTEAERMAEWWGPKGFKKFVGKMDLRPDGVMHYCMTAPTGVEMWGRFVYREIVPQERLEFVVSFSDAAGGVTRHPFSPNWPLEVYNVLNFTEKDGKTTIHMIGYPITASELECKAFAEGRKSMEAGFGGTLDQLAEFLAKR